ncbi:ubiquitin [Trifolium pratense]|uniref:RING-type E3 ubiquitin transferase n=1 Tax=Trifolium pratense TaxID=57577 RepID=A0A2K3N3Z7_TRIPR|nr:ubiquitin [Trifolium pratense]
MFCFKRVRKPAVAKQRTDRQAITEDQKPTHQTAAGVYNFSSKAAMETIDSARDDSVSLMISNPKMLDCCNCFKPLTIPVFQCDNGHIICSTCNPELRNKCPQCTLDISSKHCKAIENLLLSIGMPCPNTKYGCGEKISYLGNSKHGEECIHKPCHCPYLGCYFVGSSDSLTNHFNHKHGVSQINFSYGYFFVVSLMSNDIVLQEQNDLTLFILKSSTMALGKAVNICCVGPNFPKSEYSYDIFARTEKCKLKLQSFAANVNRFVSTTFSSNFLMIPSDSSEPLKLQICINPPMMQIFIKGSNGKTIIVNVKSSDTVLNVKLEIHYRQNIPVQHQLLICEGRRLEDDMTLGHYNIKAESTLHLSLRNSHMCHAS